MQVGQQVLSRDVVARTFMPGDVAPVNVANLLSIGAGDVPNCMLKNEGETISVGETIARTKGMFGLFKAECASPVAGTIESISHVTGQVMIRGEPHPVQVRAYLTGEVIEVITDSGVVIESDVTFVQGIFGIGGEAFGPIRMACAKPDQDLTSELIAPEMKDAILIGGARVTAEAIQTAVKTGVAAIITGGIDDQDLKDFLGYDLGVAITGAEKVGLTLIITEGFGDIAMATRTFELLASRAGDAAAVNGATQIRAGVMRPEIVVPWRASGEARPHPNPPPGGEGTASVLAINATVRIIRDPYFGMIGTIAELPPEPRALESGSKARVLAVRLASGESVIVPRANVELIEG